MMFTEENLKNYLQQYSGPNLLERLAYIVNQDTPFTSTCKSIALEYISDHQISSYHLPEFVESAGASVADSDAQELESTDKTTQECLYHGDFLRAMRNITSQSAALNNLNEILRRTIQMANVAFLDKNPGDAVSHIAKMDTLLADSYKDTGIHFTSPLIKPSLSAEEVETIWHLKFMQIVGLFAQRNFYDAAVKFVSLLNTQAPQQTSPDTPVAYLARLSTGPELGDMLFTGSDVVTYALLSVVATFDSHSMASFIDHELFYDLAEMVDNGIVELLLAFRDARFRDAGKMLAESELRLAVDFFAGPLRSFLSRLIRDRMVVQLLSVVSRASFPDLAQMLGVEPAELRREVRLLIETLELNMRIDTVADEVVYVADGGRLQDELAQTVDSFARGARTSAIVSSALNQNLL